MDNELTTVQITKGELKKLGEVAAYFRRSKTEQVAWMIDQEHDRLFGDGSAPYAPTVAESDMPADQP